MAPLSCYAAGGGDAFSCGAGQVGYVEITSFQPRKNDEKAHHQTVSQQIEINQQLTFI
jgi:hypothetical protein